LKPLSVVTAQDRREELAFDALLRRHGSMVLSVSRRVLHHAQDAEDVFQATFLLLARKAASIRKRDSLACWLHGVAHRLALKARAQTARRHALEKREGQEYFLALLFGQGLVGHWASPSIDR
jgi:DNA-directed RNA polymerase specialized sigma24 family protein